MLDSVNLMVVPELADVESNRAMFPALPNVKSTPIPQISNVTFCSKAEVTP